MYRTPDGKEIFILDAHTHFWDGSPENQRNIHGKQFIECFFAYHTALSPKEELLVAVASSRSTPRTTSTATCSSTGPTTWRSSRPRCSAISTRTASATSSASTEMAKRHPEDASSSTAPIDPRDGEQALEYIHWMKETYNIQGVKLYTAEWKGEFKGYKLNDAGAVPLPRALRQARDQATSTSTRARRSSR